MGKKLLLLPIWFFIFLPISIWGQCPTSVGITSNQGSNICQGTNVIFTANPTGGTSPVYEWTLNGTVVGSSSTYSSSSLNNQDKIRVKISSSTADPACETLSDIFTISVNPNRTGTVQIQANNTSICPGENINFSIASVSNAGSGPVYTWKLNGNTVGTNSSSFSSSSLQNNDEIQLSIQSSIPCTPDFTSNVIVIQEKPGTPTQPGIISGNDNICPGTSQTYSITNVNDASEYIWTLPSGWSGNSTTNSITVTSGSAVGNISVQAKNSCGTSPARVLPITVLPGTPAIPGNISGPSSVCPAISADYSIAIVPNATEYVWTLPNGTEQITNNPNITVTTNSSGNSNISVKARNSCGTSASKTLSVSVKAGKPATPGAITGNTNICPGTTHTYTIPAVQGATSYNWTLPNGWTGSSSTRSITVTSNTTGGDIIVTAQNDCNTSDSRSLSISMKDGMPATPGTISGATAVCPTTSEIYSVAAVAGATEYVWSIPGSFSTANTVTTNPSISITAGSSGSGNITVKARNDCGTSTAASLAISISPPAPVVPGNITGPLNVCSTATGISYSVAAVTNATSYIWSLPTGWNITSGINTRTITVSSSSNSGTISVIARNDCGDSPAKSISVNSTSGVPAQPGTITSSLGNNQNICPPLSGITFTVPAVSGATGYNWKLPPGWEIASGANTRSITVNVTANAPYQNEIVSVTATNVCGESQPRNFTNITVSNFIITDLGEDQLVCRARNQIPIDIELYFGGSNRLKPVWSTSGDGSFPDLPDIGNGNGSNNIPRNFRIHYIPGPTDITREYVTITMTVPKPHQQNPCGTGIDQMRVYFLDNPTASFSTTNSEICYNTNTSLNISGTPNTTVIYSNGSGNTTVALDASGNGTITTGNLTQTTTYTLQSIAYTNGPGCSQNISSNTTITVNPIPSATLNYNDGPFCNSDSGSYTPSFTNTVGKFQGGTFSATGININTTDGSFSPNRVSPDTYTITYSFNDPQSCGYEDITTDIVVHDVITIPSQPSNVRVCEGDAIDLSIEATGDGLGYQWYKGSGTGSPISGATSSEFNIGASSVSDSGTYYVMVTGISPCTELKSEEIEVIVDEQIQITEISTNADNNEICENGSVTFSVSATAGIETLQYQWYNSDGPISGATGNTYVLNNASLANADDYYVEIKGSTGYICNSATSETISLMVNEIPNTDINYSGPFCNSDSELKSVTFSNTAGDYTGGSFSYVVVSGGNNLDIDSESGEIDPSSSDSGEYEVSYTIAETGGCVQVIETTQVTITEAPTAIITFTDNQTEFCNDASQGIITPELSGTGNYTGGTFGGISGINASTGAINLDGLTAGDYTITYSIPASDGCPAQSVELDILIHEKLMITSQPFNIGACSGEEIELEVAASGDNLNYQWYKGTYPGTSLNGATTANFGISPVSSADDGIYYVEVSAANSCSSVRSDEITVSVDENIIVSTQPQDQSACVGDDITFNIAATANGGSVNYQWLFNGADLTGETGSSLNLTSVTTANAGEYSVFIEGPDGYTCSTINSGVAILTINEPPTVNAGDNFQVCTTSNSFNIGEDATASNYSSLKWNSSGSGTFGDDTALQTTYSPAAGETGSVTLTLKANGNGVCPAVEDEVSITIEALPVISVFEYAAEEFCISISDLQAPTITGENNYLNGTFDVEPTNAGDVLSIDGSGNVNPSLSDPGEYLITYATPSGGICAVVEKEFTLIIGNLPVASFSYDATTYCRDTREDITTDPIIAIDAGGEDADSFSYTGTGTLALENTSGAIDIFNSEAGEYTITRTVDYSGENEDGCEAVTATFDIEIFDKPIPDFTYANTEYCQDDDNPSPILAEGAITGEFTWDSSDSGANLVINQTTGVIDPASSSPGTYTVTNSVNLTNDVCEEVSFEFNIIIYEKKDPTFSYTETAYCISELQATVTPGFASGGTFSSTTLSSDYLNAATGQITWDTGSSIIGNHIINYNIPVNGPCEAVEHDFEISIDALPEGGVLSWSQEEYQRIFLTCEIQTNDLNEVLSLSGEIGEIIEWEYRTASNLNWTSYNSQNGSLNNSDFINILTGSVESTIFRVKIGNGACENGVYSQTAILSVIPSDIKPEPVKVTPEVLCYGSDISLSSEIKYVSEFGKFEGGDFTSAGIKNNGWNFTDPNGNEIPYDANANNGNPIHWHKTQPKWKFITANINSPYNTSEQWWNPRNDGMQNEHFAIAQSTYSSNMDTPPFSLLATDEAILTFDQAYNLTTNASIRVVLLKNGSEYKELYKVVGPAKSGAQDHFGYGTPDVNQMNIDLGSYIGESNLRVRFEYRGVRLGDIWAVDNIKIPEGPQDVLLQWFYDDKDPNTIPLEQIGVDNESTVSFKPRKIGWNDFEVKTALLLDSNGDPCEDINNSETIRVFVFDQYTTNVTADIGECGNTRVSLSASTEGAFQGSISDFPTIDGYRGSWIITGPNENYTLSNSDPSSTLEPVNNPNAIFEAEDLGDYSFTWKLTPEAVYPEDYKDENLIGEIIENTGCPPILNPNEVSLPSCTTLDFDGFNDFVSIDDVFAEARTIEMWIYPEASTGTIISGPGFEIKMSDLPGYITPNSRWYHIALLGNKLYIDGIDSGSTLNATGTGNQTLIGAKWNDAGKEAEKYFSGWIEEVRIWKSLVSEKEIRFMMNQRLDLNSKTSGDIEGEVVPNKTVAGSYYSSGGFNLDQDGDVFYNEKWSDLIAYYRLISAVPDPVLGIIPDTHKPVNGYTPDLSLNPIDGRLHNMTTHQQNTSPTPYFSGNDGIWSTDGTWARPTVWDAPNSNGITGPIEWNIARINHNIQSSSKDIIMLGLLSETLNMELSINADQVIRVTHYLFLDGNMDLEGESQLLQDHGSILANESQGWAEIDQQGRMSSFNYNYWTSPASNQGSNNNSGFMLNQVLLDGSNPNNPGSINFQSGYFSADGSKTVPITISDEWIWDFRGGRNDDYSDWLHLGSDYLEIVGAGYSMKGTDGTVGLGAKQNYVFRGKPNNGNIPNTDLNIVSGRDFLIGNPYPSAIDGLKFINDNQGVFNGSIYFWDHFGGSTHILKEYIGGYATWNLSGGLRAISNDWRINEEGGTGSLEPGRYIPVAQGFFISTFNGGSGGDIDFNNTQRVFVTENQPPNPNGDDPSVFLQHEDNKIKAKVTNQKSVISEDNRMKIRLRFESPKKYYRQILVTMDQNTTNGFDLGYDAPLIENNMEDMYWYFDEKPYVIQGVPNFEKEQILPLAIKSKDGGEFTIKIDKTENWPSGKELYLKDKVLDSIHDIISEVYVGTTETGGEINDRFEIVFYKEKVQDPTIPDPDDILNPDLPVIDGLVGISYSTFSKQVKISNFDMLDVSKVMIFDMGGKLIQQYDEIPTQREILLGMRPVRSGVYIIKVFSENGISDKKVVIK